MKGDSENHLKGPIIPFGAMVEYYPISAGDPSRFHFINFAIGKDGRIGHLSSKNRCKRSVDQSESNDVVFPFEDGAAQLSGRDHTFREPTLRRTNRKERRSVENFKANQESLNRQNQQMTLKPVPTFPRFKVTSSIVITMNHVFNSFFQRKKTFPMPLKYFVVAMASYTNLDVLQEKPIYYY